MKVTMLQNAETSHTFTKEERAKLKTEERAMHFRLVKGQTYDLPEPVAARLLKLKLATKA